MNMTALWDETATATDFIAIHQYLVNTGEAWKFEGHVGRTAMELIEAGEIMLGEVAHLDYYGNIVPSRHDVVPGTVGSIEYVALRGGINE